MNSGKMEGGKYGAGLEGRIPPNQAATRKFPLQTPTSRTRRLTSAKPPPLDLRNEGSLFDADHTANGVPFPRRSTAPKPQDPDPYADRRPNRLAIGVLTGLSVASFLAAYLTPATADNGVKFGAAMAMVWGIITMAGALLHRYGREFWVSRDR